MESGRLGCFHLDLRQSTFWADQKGQAARPGMAGQGLGYRVQDQPEVRFHLALPVAQCYGGMDHRQHRAATLFAGADGDLPPVGQALVGAFVLQAHLAAFADDGAYLGHAQLGGLLDRPVHALPAGQALAQVHPQGRLGQAGEGFAQLHPYGFLAHFDQLAQVLLAGAVEQLHGVAGGET
ncbi:hypothetical protein D3C84_612150 [compost metagenome]